MTEEKAERVATVLMGVAAVAAAYFVLRNPVLRRRAWQIARGAVAASGPWLVDEARHAWADSAAGAPVAHEDQRRVNSEI
jgi:hypothetical protein